MTTFFSKQQLMKSVILILLFPFFLLATPTPIRNNNRIAQIFTTVNGLPDNTINDIQKDKEGYLWIATNKGVARFDGKNFISFSKNTHPLFFDDNLVNEIQIDGNTIYLISNKFGVKLLDRASLKIKSFINDPVRSFAIKNNHQLVLKTNGDLESYTHLKLERKKSYAKYDPKSAIYYGNSIYILSQGKGIIKSKNTTLQAELIIPGDSIYMYGRLMLSKKMGLVYASGNKVYMLQKDRFVYHPLLQDKIGITNYFENNTATPYYISRSKNVMQYENNAFVNVKIPKIKNPEIRKVFFASTNCYYLATNQGLIRVTKSNKYISTIDDNPLVENDMIRIRRKIIPIDANTTYFFGHPQIMASYNGVLKNVPSKNYSMYDSTLLDDKIYCTTDSYGVISFDIKTKKIARVELNSVPEKEFFYVIEKSEDNSLFLGGTNKIVVYNPKTKNTSITPLNDLTVYAITQEGSLFWIGTNKGLRCAKYKNGRFNWITVPSIYGKSVRNIVIDNTRKKIWLGTEEDGLLIVDPKTFAFTQKKNTLLKNIATITNDQKGKMWVSTFNGIAIFDLNNNKTYQLTQRNGLSNLEYNYKSSALLADGTMIFGGLNGYDRIDFNQLQNNVNESSRIHITGIKKNKTINRPFSFFENYNNQKTIDFNTGNEDLNILISDLDITSSFGSFFTYQINLDKPIIAYNNTIKISNLPYGKYSVTIYMYDNFGNLKDKKQLTINAVVPFYYRLSFYIALSLLLLLFGSLSIYNIRKANKTEELVKDRIAMDLHDEVGTVLTRMLMTTHSKKEVVEQHAELKQGITEALFSIRTSIHALSGTKTTLEDLIDDTVEFLKKELGSSSISYQFNYNKDIPVQLLKPELFRDCKLILFEATANALKYSNATEFIVDYQLGSELVITISDNGILTDVSSIYNKGNGIGNIIKRTERNSGKYAFSCNFPHGLTIQLRFNWS